MIILISQYIISLSGGVAKPGQTRRTQDTINILMINPVPQGFVGSNPTSSIESILYHFVIQYDNGLSRPLNVLTLH